MDVCACVCARVCVPSTHPHTSPALGGACLAVWLWASPFPSLGFGVSVDRWGAGGLQGVAGPVLLEALFPSGPAGRELGGGQGLTTFLCKSQTPTPAATPQTGLFRGILAKANRKSLGMRHATKVLPRQTLSRAVLAPKGPWNPTVA